jgi:hypothetical protein
LRETAASCDEEHDRTKLNIYIQHAHTGHSIGAEKYKCEVSDGKAILRLSRRPVDENQRHDEDYLHDHELVSVDVDDSTVIDGLYSYLSARRQELSAWAVQILSQGKTFNLTVEPQLDQYHARKILRLRVVRADG